MEEALLARLRACTALTALIGSRSYWSERPQTSPLPAVVLYGISPGRDYTHAGADGLITPRVQFDCFGANTGAVVPIKRAIIAELEQTSGNFGVSFLAGERGPLTTSLPGVADKVTLISLDFFIFYKEQ